MPPARAVNAYGNHIGRPAHRRWPLIRAVAATCLVALVTSPLVTATPASGATCIFKGGTLSVRAGDETVVVQQDGVSRTILVNGEDCSPVAPVADTGSISITGGTRGQIEMFDTTGATINWGMINWSVQLGFSIRGELVLDNASGDDELHITLGASGIDLNSDGDLDVTQSGADVLSVIGGPGADSISGSGDATTGAPVPSEIDLFGGPGNDRLSGGQDDDQIDCGLGVDWVDFSGSAAAVAVNLASTNATGQGADTVTGCENVVGSSLSDMLTGDSGDNQIAPGAGNDKLDGGGGIDTVDYDDATGAVTVDLGAKTVSGGSGNDTLANIEAAVGSDFDDRITGNGLDNRLVGGAGRDTVAGEDGNDTLDGGTEIDRLVGGNGSDTCFLGPVAMSCDPSISVDPMTIGSGDSLTLTGAGWYPENGNVDLLLVPSDGSPPQNFTPLTPDAAWSIEDTLLAPSSDGIYSVVACQPCSNPDAEQATQDLIVQSSIVGPTILVEPATVHVGDLAVVSGESWDPAAGPISLFAELPDVPADEPFAIVPLDANGRFKQEFQIPMLPTGPHDVTACQRCEGPNPIVRTTSFTIESLTVPTATLELSQTQASPGDRVDALGAGWDPDAGRVRIFASTSTTEPDALIRPGADGRFEVAFEVPELGEGSYTVLACQRCNGPGRVEATATLTVPGPSPWRWIALALALAVMLTAISGLVVRRVFKSRPPPIGRIEVRLRPGGPDVLVVAEPNGLPRHTVRLIPRADPGVQQVRERSPV